MRKNQSKSQRITDEQVITALLKTSSKTEAAELLGITRRQLGLRISKPQFKEQYDKERHEFIDIATAQLQSYMSEAIKTLVNIMRNDDVAEQVRVNAANNLLNHCSKFTEVNDTIKGIEELKELLKQ